MNAKDGARKIVDDFLVRHSTPHMRSRFRAAIDAEIAAAVAEARAPLVEALGNLLDLLTAIEDWPEDATDREVLDEAAAALAAAKETPHA